MDPEILLLLERLRLILASTTRRAVRLKIFYSDGTSDRLSVPAANSPDPASMPGAPGAPRESAGRAPSPALRQQILEQLAAADRPLKAAALARRCGRSNSGHFRTTLAALVEDGEVIKTPAGNYTLPGKPGR